MKFTRRVRYQCNTSMGDSEVTENLEIEDTFDLEIGESINHMDSVDQIAKDLIHELKKEIPCVESESSFTE